MPYGLAYNPNIKSGHRNIPRFYVSDSGTNNIFVYDLNQLDILSFNPSESISRKDLHFEDSTSESRFSNLRDLAYARQTSFTDKQDIFDFLYVLSSEERIVNQDVFYSYLYRINLDTYETEYINLENNM